jgi:hypothetical protein
MLAPLSNWLAICTTVRPTYLTRRGELLDPTR